MIRVHTFVFNAFQVNTYLLINENNEGLLIDAANYSEEEDEILSHYIKTNNITLTHHLLTHAHVDHILGAKFIEERYAVKPSTHKDSMFFWDSAEEFGSVFGLSIVKPSRPDEFFNDGDEILFGSSVIKILHTPGHANGSLCYYLPEEKKLFSGDVLFAESIGRTDLPTGDMPLLLSSIREKLFTLPDDTKVFPGHGEATTIGKEKRDNPFL